MVDRARAGDQAAIEALLVANGLPLESLAAALPLAVVARSETAVVGCAAVEAYGPAGLLRSVAVATQFRGTGLGRALIGAAERAAADAGVGELFLLTETAAAWFPRFGYEHTTRADVPADLLLSPEFASVCPESSVVMRKRLA